MKSTVASLEGNKVRFSIEVETEEFDRQVDEAFKRLAQQVRLPGFRPGKAPRKLLEARLGTGVARQDALRESLPEYYAEAVRTHDVDVIAPPELEITSGAEEGGVTFEAIVQIRPTITVEGYRELSITVPGLSVTDAELEERVERLRAQHAEYVTTERAATDGDQAVIDIEGSQGGEPVDGLTASDYVYDVGSGAVVPEIDDALRGAVAGDERTFDAKHPEEGEADLSFRVVVREVRERILPGLTDEWVAEVSDHADVGTMRATFAEQLERQKVLAVVLARQQKLAEALTELVADEAPEPLVQSELQARLNNLDQRLRQQGMDLGTYLQFTGQTPDAVVEEFRGAAVQAVKLDLALRAVADGEAVDATDEDLEEHFAELSRRFGVEAERIRHDFEHAGQLSAVRSEVRKAKALDWLVGRVKMVDEDGAEVDPAALDLSAKATQESDGESE